MCEYCTVQYILDCTVHIGTSNKKNQSSAAHTLVRSVSRRESQSASLRGQRGREADETRGAAALSTARLNRTWNSTSLGFGFTQTTIESNRIEFGNRAFGFAWRVGFKKDAASESARREARDAMRSDQCAQVVSTGRIEGLIIFQVALIATISAHLTPSQKRVASSRVGICSYSFCW